jgi:broad specificity polyphosphatase/5'/3'-nucleotidase SurE
MGGDTCRSCRNPTVFVTATKDMANDSFRMVAAPNPFKETTTLKINFPAFKVGQKADVTIYNMMGKAVQRFDLDAKTGDTSAEINWDARDIAAGIYIARFTSGAMLKTVKIVKTS